MRTLFSPAFLGVEDDFFEGRTCADFGCGSAVPGTLNLLDCGAGFVHALDLNDSFVAPATEILTAETRFAGRWKLDVGSICELPYEADTFDFTVCQGVIHHIEDDQKALDEIVRTLKPGGTALLEVYGKGGIMTRIGMEIIRDEYANDPAFRALIDEQMTPDWISEQLTWLEERIEDDGSTEYRQAHAFLEAMRVLLDEDFILTLQDRAQAPLYKMYREQEFADMLGAAGFSTWRRVARKPHFRNFRKILAPMYHEYAAPLSRLFYGDGILIIVATK